VAMNITSAVCENSAAIIGHLCCQIYIVCT